MIHCELLSGVKQRSTFTLTKVPIQLSQHHVLKRLYFFLLNLLGTLVEKQLTVNARL